MKIQALHEFHDEQFSQNWSNRFIPTTERVSLFQLILDNIHNLEKETTEVLELGIGPGYLAEHILTRRNNIIYEGLDFSKAMLAIASKRLEGIQNKKIYTQADLIVSDWGKGIKTKPKIIISTWALHDLLSKKNIFKVYQAVYEILPKGGKLINGDFIKPEKSQIEYEAGRIKPSEHLDLLEKAGFQKAECIQMFEEDLENPTTANNYACFLAVK